jgi:hypothetical protein
MIHNGTRQERERSFQRTSGWNPTSRTIAIIFGVGAALAGYLGLGISIWQVARGFLPQLAYLLAVCVVGLTLFAGYQRRLITQLLQDQEVIGFTVNQLQRVEHLVQGTFGLVVNLMEEPRSDKMHHFDCITEEYVIHGSDGTYNWVFEGQCVAERSRYMVVKISGDSPCDGSALAFSATDLNGSDRKLDYRIRVDQPYCKVVAIFFRQELRKDDAFHIKVSCRWDNTFPRTRRFDYVFSPWGVYMNAGVEKIIGRLVADVKLVDFSLNKLEDGEWVRTAAQPREVHSSRRHTELEWEATNPSHIYQLAFEKEDEGTA